MKKTLIATLIVLGNFSHAHATTDLFECTTKIVDLKTNASSESSGLIAGQRMLTPVDASTGQPYPGDIEVTKAETHFDLKLQETEATYVIKLNLNYAFARKLQGPADTRQSTCKAISVERCDSMNLCSGADNICLTTPNPYDARYGWDVTTLNQNVPVFNEQLFHDVDMIVPIDQTHPNGARVTVSCKLQGTFF